MGGVCELDESGRGLGGFADAAMFDQENLKFLFVNTNLTLDRYSFLNLFSPNFIEFS